MKIWIDTNESGDVTGIYRNPQRDGQESADDSDPRVTAYLEAKAARLAGQS